MHYVTWWPWKKRSTHQGFNLKTKETKFSHFHLPCEAKKMWVSTHSSECGNFPLLLVHLSPKLGIYHTQGCHHFMLWEAVFKLWNKASSYTFAFIFYLGYGLVKDIFGDKLFFSTTINMGLVNKVFMVNKWNHKVYNILSIIQIRKLTKRKGMTSKTWIELNSLNTKSSYMA